MRLRQMCSVECRAPCQRRSAFCVLERQIGSSSRWVDVVATLLASQLLSVADLEDSGGYLKWRDTRGWRSGVTVIPASLKLRTTSATPDFSWTLSTSPSFTISSTVHESIFGGKSLLSPELDFAMNNACHGVMRSVELATPNSSHQGS